MGQRQRNLELVRRAQAGDRSAEQELITSNWKFLQKKIPKIIPREIDRQDLLQEASVGLLEAVRTFDFDKSGSLLTHAGWMIRKHVSAYLAKHSRLVRLPYWAHEVWSKDRELTLQSPELDDDEVAEELGVPVRALRSIREAGKPWSSMESTGSGGKRRCQEDSSLTVSQRLESPDDGPEELACRDSVKEMLRGLLLDLDPALSSVLWKRFRMDGSTGKQPSYRAISEEIGVSAQATQQRHNRALLKLQAKLREKGIEREDL